VLPGRTKRRRTRCCSFNPHRARRPGATRAAVYGSARVHGFQSSPGPEARCYETITLREISMKLFQSSPGPEARCYQRWPTKGWGPKSFQSSPGPEARCYPGASPILTTAMQVSILTGPGGPVLLHFRVPLTALCAVSILTGPGGPVLHQKKQREGEQDAVSILTGPGGPVLRTTSTRRCPRWFRFNPHRARRPGATVLVVTGFAPGFPGFNPHRARRPGATSP